jgi:hypothetical protein
MFTEPQQQRGFPKCVSLSIEFNQHAVNYQTVEQWLNERRDSGTEVEWVSDEERQRAIDHNSVWVCFWYPDTPVGSCEIAASSFEALMAAVNGG